MKIKEMKCNKNEYPKKKERKKDEYIQGTYPNEKKEQIKKEESIKKEIQGYREINKVKKKEVRIAINYV